MPTEQPTEQPNATEPGICTLTAHTPCPSLFEVLQTKDGETIPFAHESIRFTINGRDPRKPHVKDTPTATWRIEKVATHQRDIAIAWLTAHGISAS